jgi:hypothetical protein
MDKPIIERRYSGGQADRWSDLANELVRPKVDVIMVNTTTGGPGGKESHEHDPDRLPHGIRPGGSGAR